MQPIHADQDFDSDPPLMSSQATTTDYHLSFKNTTLLRNSLMYFATTCERVL